jgi:hypothetical protein
MIVILLVLIAVVFAFRLHLGLGVRSLVKASGPARLAAKERLTIETWFDRTPPTPPGNLRGGLAPTIQALQSYIHAPHQTTHTTAPFDSTGGDLIVMAASTHNGALLTPTDTYHNTWISLAGPTDAKSVYNLRSEMWYAKNPRVGLGHTVTMTLSSPQSLVISVFVVKGVDPTTPLDAWSLLGDDGGTETTHVASPTITTKGEDDLLIAFGKCALGDWTAYGNLAMKPDASSAFLVAESGLATTPGSYSSDFELSVPSSWQSAIVAVRHGLARARPAPITLAWHASTDNVGVVGYRVERCQGSECNDFQQIGTSIGNSFVDSELASSAIYRYRVRAVDAASNASAYSNVTEVSTDASAEATEKSVEISRKS